MASDDRGVEGQYFIEQNTLRANFFEIDAIN